MSDVNKLKLELETEKNILKSLYTGENEETVKEQTLFGFGQIPVLSKNTFNNLLKEIKNSNIIIKGNNEQVKKSLSAKIKEMKMLGIQMELEKNIYTNLWKKWAKMNNHVLTIKEVQNLQNWEPNLSKTFLNDSKNSINFDKIETFSSIAKPQEDFLIEEINTSHISDEKIEKEEEEQNEIPLEAITCYKNKTLLFKVLEINNLTFDEANNYLQKKRVLFTNNYLKGFYNNEKLLKEFKKVQDKINLENIANITLYVITTSVKGDIVNNDIGLFADFQSAENYIKEVLANEISQDCETMLKLIAETFSVETICERNNNSKNKKQTPIMKAKGVSLKKKDESDEHVYVLIQTTWCKVLRYYLEQQMNFIDEININMEEYEEGKEEELIKKITEEATTPEEYLYYMEKYESVLSNVLQSKFAIFNDMVALISVYKAVCDQKNSDCYGSSVFIYEIKNIGVNWRQAVLKLINSFNKSITLEEVLEELQSFANITMVELLKKREQDSEKSISSEDLEIKVTSSDNKHFKNKEKNMYSFNASVLINGVVNEELSQKLIDSLVDVLPESDLNVNFIYDKHLMF